MSFIDKLHNGLNEITAPEKDELLKESKNLDVQISESSLLKESINKLNQKIKESRTGKERNILEEQLEELKKINELYQEYIKTNITNSTKKELNQLISGISSQINLERNRISDDSNKLESIIKTENEKLEDTLDIISANTIRDTVENSIDIKGINESIPTEQYQDFFDIITVTYIDFLENEKQLSEEQHKSLTENEGLYLDNNDINIFINKLINKLSKTNIDLNFDFKIKLKKGLYKKNLTINLQKNIDKLKEKERIKNEAGKKEKARIEAEKAERARIEDEKLRIQQFEENIDKLPGRERVKYIKGLLDTEEFKPFLESVINKIEGKTIYLDDGKKVLLDKNYIEKNKEKIINNLKTLILLIIELESDGNPKAENSISSASGLGQWLINNGEESTEYLYNRNWKSKKIEGINPKKERVVWLTNSFETTLRNIKNKYSDKILKKFNFIPDDFNQKTNLSPLNLTLRQQIQLLILDLGSNTKKIKNGNGIKDFLGTAILGNSWAMKEIYKIFHHTQPDEETLKRIKKITPKYTEELITLNENY